MSLVKRILILSANPKDTARLRLDKELHEIDEGLRRAKLRERFDIHQKWAVNLRDLRRTILDYNPQIVHFCGHGKEEGLIVEDDYGNAIVVNPDALSGLFELFTNEVECVLLNACYSEIQANAINQYIPYVIGMSKGIEDNAAIEFAVGFYDALGAGRLFEDAFKFGCNAIQLYDLPDHLTPVLKKKANTQAQQNISHENGDSKQETTSKPGVKFSANTYFSGTKIRGVAGRDIIRSVSGAPDREGATPGIEFERSHFENVEIEDIAGRDILDTPENSLKRKEDDE